MVNPYHLNITRRHLNRQQRDDLIRTLAGFTTLTGVAEYSERKIAEMVGVSKGTVGDALRSTAQNYAVDRPLIKGKDGRTRSKPKKKTAVIAKTAAETQRTIAALDIIPAFFYVPQNPQNRLFYRGAKIIGASRRRPPFL